MLLVLLPVRNAANDLSGYFHSVSRFADGVLALDDGSIDETPEMLRQEKLVKGILHNPPRSGFAGWDDAANRNRLLAAAADFEPDWILSLDADERLDEADGWSLRTFTLTDAIPGLAYGFRCYPTSDDGRWYLPPPIWIYRLFHYERGQRFPDQRFHFAPIPTDVPREAYLRTTFRIQHLGGFDNARRAARYEKYRDADPDRRFWPSYSALLAPIDDDLLLPWPERPADEPALLWEDPGTPEPARSLRRAVIVLDDNASDEEVRTTMSVLSRSQRERFETVLVGDRQSFVNDGSAVVVLPGATRGASLQGALMVTEADLLIVLDAGQTVDPADLTRLWQALGEGYGVVRCAIVTPDTNDRARCVQWLRANWPEAPGELGSWRPVGYRRDALAELGPIPELATFDRDAESWLIRSLARKGVLVGRVPATIVDRAPRPGEPGCTASVARGKAWAEIDLALAGPHPIPARDRARRFIAQVTGDTPDVPRASIAASAAGYAARVTFGKPGEGWALAGWPARTIGVIGCSPGGRVSISITRCDLAGGRVRVTDGVAVSGVPAPARIDSHAAHILRDQLELAIGAPIDDAVLLASEPGASAFATLRERFRRGDLAGEWRNLRATTASTMTAVQLTAVMLRLATLPGTAIDRVTLNTESPVGEAVIAALRLPAASSMRDRLRSVTWA